jgi:hypothetical protein
MRRLLPLFAILAAVLFIVPALTKKHSSGPSSGTKASTALDALNRVDKSEQRYLSAHNRYTSHIADLVTFAPKLATDLATVRIQLDVSSDGQSFLAQVSSDNLSLVRARNKTKVSADSCTVLKSGKGVACPSSAS